MAPNEIEVTVFSLDDGETLPVDRLTGWLTGEEIARSGQFRFPVHRDRYIRGRAMVRWLLARQLGVPEQSLRMETGSHGKPFLTGHALHFNLSHSEGLAACAVSRIPSIGIDVECFSRQVNIAGLSERCFQESEREVMNQNRGEDLQKAFFWLWTAKEARMKASGEGFSLEPKRIRVITDGMLPQTCPEPANPPAWIEPVRWDHWQAACCVVAFEPFQVRQAAEMPVF